MNGEDVTLVFTEGGTVAHILGLLSSPNDIGAESLCGRSAWPGYWHGTGSQDEIERAQDLKLCVRCAGVLSHRRGGMFTR